MAKTTSVIGGASKSHRNLIALQLHLITFSYRLTIYLAIMHKPSLYISTLATLRCFSSIVRRPSYLFGAERKPKDIVLLPSRSAVPQSTHRGQRGGRRKYKERLASLDPPPTCVLLMTLVMI